MALLLNDVNQLLTTVSRPFFSFVDILVLTLQAVAIVSLLLSL